MSRLPIVICSLCLLELACEDCRQQTESTVPESSVHGQSGDYTIQEYTLNGWCGMPDNEPFIIRMSFECESARCQYDETGERIDKEMPCIGASLFVKVPLTKVSEGTVEAQQLGRTLIRMDERVCDPAFTGDPTNEICEHAFISDAVIGTIRVESIEPELKVTLDLRLENWLGYWREVHAVCQSRKEEVCE
jgi:hypothetical protein